MSKEIGYNCYSDSSYSDSSYTDTTSTCYSDGYTDGATLYPNAPKDGSELANKLEGVKDAKIVRAMLNSKKGPFRNLAVDILNRLQ